MFVTVMIMMLLFMLANNMAFLLLVNYIVKVKGENGLFVFFFMLANMV